MNRFSLAALVFGFGAVARLAAAPVSPPVAPDAAQPVDNSVIRVTVDDNPVIFRGANPQRINGSVMVPLRGVFEKLGAVVEFHGSTRTIEATRGNTDLILRLGDPNAYINNSAVPLAQAPVVVTGSTLVPLRFVAEVFGASVVWLPDQQLVAIRTGNRRGRGNEVAGRVVAIDTTSIPNTITVRQKDQTWQVPIATDTLVLVQQGDQPATQSAITSIAPGDYVDITRSSAEGPASTILLKFAEIRGVVKDVVSLPDGSHVILFDDGANAQVATDAVMTRHGASILWSDIKPGVRVDVKMDTNNKLGYSVAVLESEPAPTPVPERSVAIDSFRVDAAGPLKGGDTITATLRGTAGGTAEFAIPGVADSVEMKEQQPGIYEGSFIIPQTVNVNGASVIGKLTIPGGRTPVLIQAAQTITIDSKPPVVSNLTPLPDSDVANGRPRISVTLDDGNGSGVDPNSAHLFVDGQDVTGSAIVTQQFATYQPSTPMGNGEHRVRFNVADMVGNSSEKEWKFSIDARNGLVTSLESNIRPDSSHISATRPLRLTLRAQPGGHAVFSVGSVIGDLPMNETSPGVYQADYTPDRGASADNASVVVKFVAASGAEITITLDTPVTIDAAAASRPTITSPKTGDTVPGHCVVEGIAAPNATVLVTVTYKSPSVGDIFKRAGSAASTEVQADDTGHWRTEDLKLSSGGFFATATGTLYTATAVVVDATGQQSVPDVVKFRQR